MNKDSCHLCHPSCTADKKMSSRITKTGRTQPKTKREPGDNMRGVSTDRPTMVPTPSARQTTVKQRQIHEKGRSSTRDKRCFDENINKGNAVTKAQTYGDCQ
jgi:hypothetical protein